MRLSQASVLTTGALLMGGLIGLGVSPWLLAALLLLGPPLIMGLWRFSLVLVVALLLFLSASFSPAFQPPGIDTLRWIVLLIAVCIGSLRYLASRTVTSSSQTSVPLITLCVFAIASSIWSVSPFFSLSRALSFALLPVLWFLAQLSGTTAHRFLSVTRAVAVSLALANSAALIAGVRVFQGRFAGVFENPNSLGVASALTLPAVLSAAAETPNWRRRSFWVVLALAIATQVVIARSRAGVAAMGAGYLYQCVAYARRRGRDRRSPLSIPSKFVLALPGVVALGLAISLSDRFSRVNTRSQLWSTFGDLFSRRPLFGYGFGTTERVLAPLIPHAEIGLTETEVGVQFHNAYLTVLTDLGLLGAALLILALGFALRGSGRAEPALAAIVVSGMASALFESWLYAVGSGFPLLFWAAVLYLSGDRREKGKHLRAHRSVRPYLSRAVRR